MIFKLLCIHFLNTSKYKDTMAELVTPLAYESEVSGVSGSNPGLFVLTKCEKNVVIKKLRNVKKCGYKQNKNCEKMWL